MMKDETDFFETIAVWKIRIKKTALGFLIFTLFPVTGFLQAGMPGPPPAGSGLQSQSPSQPANSSSSTSAQNTNASAGSTSTQFLIGGGLGLSDPNLLFTGSRKEAYNKDGYKGTIEHFYILGVEVNTVIDASKYDRQVSVLGNETIDSGVLHYNILYPGTANESYGPDSMRREVHTEKSCEEGENCWGVADPPFQTTDTRTYGPDGKGGLWVTAATHYAKQHTEIFSIVDRTENWDWVVENGQETSRKNGYTSDLRQESKEWTEGDDEFSSYKVSLSIDRFVNSIEAVSKESSSSFRKSKNDEDILLTDDASILDATGVIYQKLEKKFSDDGVLQSVNWELMTTGVGKDQIKINISTEYDAQGRKVKDSFNYVKTKTSGKSLKYETYSRVIKYSAGKPSSLVVAANGQAVLWVTWDSNGFVSDYSSASRAELEAAYSAQQALEYQMIGAFKAEADKKKLTYYTSGWSVQFGSYMSGGWPPLLWPPKIP